MIVDKASPLVPELRFAEFQRSGSWKRDQVGNIASILKGKGISKADVVEGGATPCIRYAELYTCYGEVIREVISRTNVPQEDLMLSQAEDVIVPASGETKADIARAACVLPEGVALGSDLNILRSDLYGPFLSYLLNSPLRHKIAHLAQGDTVAHLYPGQLSRVSLAYPLPPEQQKIANCLGSLDNLIAAEDWKLEALRQHKQGLMEGLFPRIDEGQPRLRFLEYQRTLEWEPCKISDLLEKVSSPVSVEADRKYQEIGVRSHGKGVFHKAPTLGSRLGAKRVFHVIENALVFNIVFAWERAVATTSCEEKGMIASHRFPMYLPKSGKCDIRFMKYAFLTQRGAHLLRVASPGGAGRNRTLGQAELMTLTMIVPSRGEQTSIANAIEAVEGLIEAQAGKCSLMRQHKMGLMQQMFPIPEAI